MEVEPTCFGLATMFRFSAGVLTLNVAAGVHSALEALIQHSYIISLIVVRTFVIKGAGDFWVSICDTRITNSAKAQGVLCLGGLPSMGSLCPEGSLSRGSLSGGSLSREFCLGVSVRETPCMVKCGRYVAYLNAFLFFHLCGVNEPSTIM